MTASECRPLPDLDAVLPQPSRPAPDVSRIAGVGTAVTGTPYSQHELLEAFEITDPRVRSVFLNSTIRQRYLSLPPRGPDGRRVAEAQGDLLGKHKALAVQMGERALRACLANAGAEVADIDCLCCVTSTGYLTPGLSALLIRELGIPPRCSRVDIVGMGCNAGLNALNLTAGWSVAHPGQLAVVLCAEACSAAYVFDATMRTAVVNSLFGDGAAAVALVAGPGADAATQGGGEDQGGRAAAEPRVLSFTSRIMTAAIDDMRYDWDAGQGKFSFFLDPGIPYLVGAHAELAVDELVSGAGLRRSDIRHWLVHSGGKKVIDAIMVNLGLTRYDLRHTTAVMRDFGNLSSGSFLFSYQRLIREGVTRPGDYGVLMAMGPGLAIETALIQW